MLNSTRFNRITRISIPAHLDTSFIMLCKAFILILYALDCGLNCLFCEIVPNPVEVWKLAVYFFRNRLFFCRSVCEKFCMPPALLYTRVILFSKFSLLILIVLFTLRRCFQPLNLLNLSCLKVTIVIWKLFIAQSFQQFKTFDWNCLLLLCCAYLIKLIEFVMPEHSGF